MKNENLKAIVGLVVAIALVVVMAYILKLTNNIQSGGGIGRRAHTDFVYIRGGYMKFSSYIYYS